MPLKFNKFLKMIDFISNFLDYFFYKKCYLCKSKADIGLLCNKCYEAIKNKAIKKTKIVNGIKIQGFFTYSNEVKKLIRAIKYHNKRDLALPIAKLLTDLVDLDKNTEIIPIPLHHTRQKRRKYNHMELIASHLGCKVNTDIVKRIKDTAPQYKLSQKERRENLQGAFKIEGNSNKKLVLFDDICTTGVTMEELVNELRKSNINNIEGLVISFARS